jgi:hypothetical protein
VCDDKNKNDDSISEEEEVVVYEGMRNHHKEQFLFIDLTLSAGTT